jgi:predicted Fe-Mo cluster-binding NifX family protein
MSIRVALAINSDGTQLEHFGHSGRFAIYEVEPDGLEPIPLEVRDSAPFCRQDEKQNKLETVAELLADCRLVVCAAIGACGELELAFQHVDALPFEGSIDEALKAVANPRSPVWLNA